VINTLRDIYSLNSKELN